MKDYHDSHLNHIAFYAGKQSVHTALALIFEKLVMEPES